jgi:hypothetical protein
MAFFKDYGALGSVVQSGSGFDAWRNGRWIGQYDTLNRALYALLLESGVYNDGLD